MRKWDVTVGDRERSTAIVRSVCDSLLGADPGILDWGAALLQCHAGQVFGDARLLAHAEVLRDALVERLPAFAAHTGLYGGVSGIGWTCAHIDRCLGSTDESNYEEIDDFLMADLAQNGLAGHYDLIGGLVGIAVYFLERLPSPAGHAGLERILSLLEQRAEWSGDMAKWRTAPELLPDFQQKLAPNGYYNAGLAHGSPGVLALAALVARHSIERERCQRLADGAVNWILSLRNLASARGQVPSWYSETHSGGASRVAWCYGDLGVSIALALAANEFRQPAWLSVARDLAVSSSGRRDEQIRINDAGLCHGSAGAAHLLSRVTQLVADERLDVSAAHWYDQTLRFVAERPGRYGFQTLLSKLDGGHWIDEWQDSAQFLTGSTGAALALLATVSTHDPSWDRALLFS